jgi:uncharacterized UBP type Zn finger protein
MTMTNRVDTPVDLTAPCAHERQVKIRAVKKPVPGCEECLATGSRWVHLRECLVCGHIGCCDSSPNRHATAHFHATRHPIVASAEPGETWSWCYVDSRFLSADD